MDEGVAQIRGSAWRSPEQRPRKALAAATVRLALVAGRLARKRDPERGSRPLAGRLENELAAHLPQQVSRDIQAQARAVAADLCSTAGEAGENSFSVCRRNSRAVVGDGEAEPAGGLVRRYLARDLPCAPPVLPGVAKKCPEDLVRLVRTRHCQPAAAPVPQLK